MKTIYTVFIVPSFAKAAEFATRQEALDYIESKVNGMYALIEMYRR